MAAAQRKQLFHKGCGKRGAHARVTDGDAPSFQLQFINRMCADFRAEIAYQAETPFLFERRDDILKKAEHTAIGDIYRLDQLAWLDERSSRRIEFENWVVAAE